MSNYQGWTKADALQIVYSVHRTTHAGPNQYTAAFVVDKNNKQMLDTATAWAKTGKTTPKIVETENKDFTITIVSSPGQSSEGGKLSFCMCKVEKPGIPTFTVGINTSLLTNAILQSTLIHGEFQEKMTFARQTGCLGILHPKMKEYQDMLNDLSLKQSMKSGKTTKWEIGHSYATLTKEDVMLGKFPQILRLESIGRDAIYSLNFQNPTEICVCTPTWLSNTNSRDELIEQGFKWLDYDSQNPPTTCPSRQHKELVFTVDDTYYTEVVPNVLRNIKPDAVSVPAGYIIRRNLSDSCKYALSIFRWRPDIAIQMLEDSISKANKMRSMSNYRPDTTVYTLRLKYNGKTTSYYAYYDFYSAILEIMKQEAQTINTQKGTDNNA